MTLSNYECVGNLGGSPTLRKVMVQEEDRTVVNFSVRISKDQKTDSGKYEEKWGYWLQVSIWGWMANQAMKLKKGDRVFVKGELFHEAWEDEGEVKGALKLRADYVALDLLSVAE